jgi:hypothetical protein
MEEQMADNSDNGFLYFMVGVLVIGLIGLGYFYYNGTPRTGVNNPTVIEKTTTERVPSDTNTNINVNPPANPAPGGY